MKILRIAGCVCVLTMFGGCAVYTPRPVVVVDPMPHPVVVVEPVVTHVPVVPVVTHVPAGRGGFCPPGQAKKGNC